MVENISNTVRVYNIGDNYYKFDFGQKFYLIDLVELQDFDQMSKYNYDNQFNLSYMLNVWSDYFPEHYKLLFMKISYNITFRELFETIMPKIFKEFMISEDEYLNEQLYNNVEFSSFF